MKSRDAYTAIADPTRRRILDLLNRHRRALEAGTIAANFEEISRPAISRHLRVLRECVLVTSFRRGSHQNYVLNSEPINDIRDGWLATFAEARDLSLVKMR